MKCKLWFLFFAVVAVCLTSCGQQSSAFVDPTIERSYAEPSWTGETYTWKSLAKQAAYIVEADVTGLKYGDEFGIEEWDITCLTVRTSLKGVLNGNIFVRDTAWLYLPDGGTPDPASVMTERSLCGEPMMRAGHRVILFLEATDTVLSNGYLVYTLVNGGAVAKFFYDEDGTYHNALLYSKAYCSDIESKGETQMPVLDDMAPKTLAQLQALIEE